MDSALVHFRPTSMEHTSPLVLRWTFEDKPICRRYLAALKRAIELADVYQPTRFYNFPKSKYTEEYLVTHLQSAIDKVNSVYPDLITDTPKLGMTQDDLNELHRNFEIKRGPLNDPASTYSNSSYELKDAFDDLNILIHTYEDADFRNAYGGRNRSPFAILTYGLDGDRIMRYPLEDEDFLEFNFQQEFGGWSLNYCEVGKPLHDIWRDGDLGIVDEAILPLQFYSADGFLNFGCPVTEDYHLQKVKEFYEWWDENKEAIESKGFVKYSPRNSLGQIHLGSLDRDYGAIKGLNDQEIVQLVSNYQQFDKVEIEAEQKSTFLKNFDRIFTVFHSR